MVQSYLLAAIALLSLVTLLMMALIIALSIRLRRAEIITMRKIGGARHTIGFILGSEVAIVFTAGAMIAALLTAITHRFGPEFIRQFLV